MHNSLDTAAGARLMPGPVHNAGVELPDTCRIRTATEPHRLEPGGFGEANSLFNGVEH
jgi:hypothetical protein